MNTLCEVCNKEKEQCFICKGKSASVCVEHNVNMTLFKCKPVCKTCLSTFKCTINIAKPETLVEYHDESPTVTKKPRKYNYISSFILKFKSKPEVEKPKPVIIECNNIKQFCPECRKKETLNCSIHNLNIKNTCDTCVKLLLCETCCKFNETTWYHKCGRFCTDCTKKIEVDLRPITLCKLFGDDISSMLPPKWEIYCKKCIVGFPEDFQKKEYELLKKLNSA